MFFGGEGCFLFLFHFIYFTCLAIEDEKTNSELFSVDARYKNHTAMLTDSKERTIKQSSRWKQKERTRRCQQN